MVALRAKTIFYKTQRFLKINIIQQNNISQNNILE